MQGQGQKYGQKHETKELVQFHNHLHALTMLTTTTNLEGQVAEPLRQVELSFTFCNASCDVARNLSSIA